MLVLSDTTPLNYLVQIGYADLLPRFYGSITVSRTVIAELRHERAPRAVSDWAALPPDWLLVHDDVPIMSRILETLDPGEATIISLAIHLKADLVLIDEQAGRRAALSLRLRLGGTLGVLRAAAALGFVDLRESMTRLRELGCFISDALWIELLGG